MAEGREILGAPLLPMQVRVVQAQVRFPVYEAGYPTVDLEIEIHPGNSIVANPIKTKVHLNAPMSQNHIELYQRLHDVAVAALKERLTEQVF